MSIKAVIFDLDGVIVSTDENHYQAWKTIAEEEGLLLDRSANESLRGVSRAECVEILLATSEREFSDTEKEAFCKRKNHYYKESLNALSSRDILPGVMDLLNDLKQREILIAIGSSSRNTPYILEKIGLREMFDAVADGNMITKSKPDPEVFLLAAEKLNVSPNECVVIEDAEAGIEAALTASMKTVGVGSALSCLKAHSQIDRLSGMGVDELLNL